MHSRLSEGEKYDQFVRAKEGRIDVMIGPRSALFTPFPNIGLIVIDEEHETSYHSNSMPKYHAREVAVKPKNLPGEAEPAAAPAGGSSLADELKKLKELFDAGAITEQEYQAAKAKLLGQ